MDPQRLPPGLQGNWKELISGGSADKWVELKSIKFYTNAWIVKDNKVLLGYKKRGIGQGFYNGFGGKVEPGETSGQAAIRELEEESGIRAPLEHAGVLFFTTNEKEWAFHIDLYRATEYTGTIIETDEMRPEWFDIDNLPLDHMWETDRHWLPVLLAGTLFVGRADYALVEGKSRPVKWWVATSLA